MEFRLATTKDIEQLAMLRIQMLQEVASDVPPSLLYTITNYLDKHILDKTSELTISSARLRILFMAPTQAI